MNLLKMIKSKIYFIYIFIYIFYLASYCENSILKTKIYIRWTHRYWIKISSASLVCFIGKPVDSVQFLVKASISDFDFQNTAPT